jgi:RNA polymerase sigma-70 factor
MTPHTPTPSSVFLAELDGEHREHYASSESLENRLQSLFDDGKAEWKDVSLEPLIYAQHAAQRINRMDADGTSLEKLRAADLYIATATATCDEKAIAAFEGRYGPDIVMTLGRHGLTGEVVDEVKQELLRRFFVGDEKKQPSILQYSGKASLLGWIRTTAVRAAIDHCRKDNRYVLVDEPLLDAFEPPSDDPEVQYMKDRYQKEFRGCIHEAIVGLPAEDRMILRHYHVDEMNIDQIGRLLQTHRATAARRLNKIREDVEKTARQNVMDKLRLSQNEYDSVLRLIRSQMHLSICRVLSDDKTKDGA